MLVISHRGVRAPATPSAVGFGSPSDNTLEAFERAVQLGVDGIETDVRLSADGQAVLYHDRLAPDGREISALLRDELSSQVGFPVPTLDEALARWDHLLWVLEIKTPRVVEAVVAALRRYGGTRRCLVISFWHPIIRQVRTELDVDCGLSVRHRPLAFVPIELGEKPDDPHVKTVVWDYEFLDADLVQDAKSQGWKNLVFGPETPAEHHQCAELGVDGVITDSPHYLLSTAPPDVTPIPA